jgi:hypothetical protein
MEGNLLILAGTAASLAIVHTLIGPDHYLPFIAMSRARDWSLKRTLGITAACGLGHVAGSIALGVLGILLGLALGGLEWIEGVRGQVAGWLLIGFGLAYTAWGIRRGVRNRPHSHWHTHKDGVAHAHRHRHAGTHAHAHDESAPAALEAASLTPWVLFTIFVFGPCEPLIPLLMYPAAEGSWGGVALVGGVFGVLTVTTMLGAVWVGYVGLSRLSFGRMERYSHALAGLAVLACGAAIQLGL